MESVTAGSVCGNGHPGGSNRSIDAGYVVSERTAPAFAGGSVVRDFEPVMTMTDKDLDPRWAELDVAELDSAGRIRPPGKAAT